MQQNAEIFRCGVFPENNNILFSILEDNLFVATLPTDGCQNQETVFEYLLLKKPEIDLMLLQIPDSSFVLKVC
ncbi:MAG TPA: hypothetical protein ENN90_05900 [Mariniphaga anaerophila]|uniref:Uncharacterized protein n=1 Tax=Mariniphaga anaerophila TaxID=1484053 RepID=A0A831PPZ9_9BACT|nr:hypothetical protein [Mariniphaga anaerophila]